MANNVVAGLFGVTPYDVSSNAVNQEAQLATNFAQLTPQQQGQYGMFAGGAGLARAAAQAAGGGDPAMQQAQQMQQVKQYAADNNIDINTPTGLRQLAVYANQIGAAEGAAFFGQRAMTIKAQQAETGLKNAQAVKALKEPVGTESERSRNLLVQVEQRLANGESVPPEALNQAALVLQDLSKPKSFFDAASGQMITQPGINPLQALPNLSAAITGNKVQPPAAGVSGQGNAPAQQGAVTQYPGGIQTTQVVAPKMDAKTLTDLGTIEADITRIDASLKNIADVKSTIGGLDLGLLANTGRAIMSGLGINTEDRIAFDKAQRTVQQQANNLLLLAKGVQTEGDAKRAYETIMNPDTWKNADALKAAYADLEQTTKDTKAALIKKKEVLQSGGRSTTTTQNQAPKMARDAAFNALKNANPKASDAALNKKLDEMGY